MTLTSTTSRIGSSGTASDTLLPHWSQHRVADFVKRVVQERKRRPQHRDADARCDGPEWDPCLERLIVLRPVEHRAPAVGVDAAEPDELQPRRRQDRIDRGTEEIRDEQR